jgi:hypothetical protein
MHALVVASTSRIYDGVALVMGNSACENVPWLSHPVSDASLQAFGTCIGRMLAGSKQ